MEILGSESSSTFFSSLPDDILFRVLLWLPVESLLRFKRVSRDWLSLIQSSHFVHQHYHFNNKWATSTSSSDYDHNLILLTSPDEYGYDHHDHHQFFSLFTVEDEYELMLDFPAIEAPYKFNTVKMVASCRGIICLRQDRTICLWNPATKQSTTLPSLPQEPIDCEFGFGFDLKTDCYKVVCINKRMKHTHVYSFGHSYWTSKECSIVDDVCTFQWPALKTPYRDSICCWLLQPYTESIPHLILSFDCTNEVFKIIRLSETIIETPLALFILSENIACINTEGDSQTYQVWMLNAYNVDQHSWTKLYSFDLVRTSLQWMTWFSNEDGEFFLFLKDQVLWLYDIVAQQGRQLRFGFEVVTYEETLVSVERGSSAATGPSSEFQGQHAMMSINQSTTGSDKCWGDANITEVVVFKILLWLPVASLLRFKLVCKSWCSLIKSSDFVAQHLHLHQNDKENINFILVSSPPICNPLFEDSSYPSPATSYSCLLSTDKLELLDLPYHNTWMGADVTIITSLDGIICLQVSREIHAYLWNPATKQFRVVKAEPTGVLQRGDEKRRFYVGFGFDVKTNDYKVVKFFRCDEITCVKVYSLRTGSWRCIHDEILPNVALIRRCMRTTYRKDINCWLADVDLDTCVWSILSFDFSNEVFELIALPDGINYESHYVYGLAVLSENIACIVTDGNYNSEHAPNWHCEIWLMNEYGVKDSWTKLYTVGPFSQEWYLRAEFSKKNCDYILLQKGGLLYEYELATQETKELSVEVPKYYQVAVYKESLVAVK